jgi:hypothetical protein
MFTRAKSSRSKKATPAKPPQTPAKIRSMPRLTARKMNDPLLKAPDVLFLDEFNALYDALVKMKDKLVAAKTKSELVAKDICLDGGFVCHGFF